MLLKYHFVIHFFFYFNILIGFCQIGHTCVLLLCFSYTYIRATVNYLVTINGNKADRGN